jgi:hypothetical protein
VVKTLKSQISDFQFQLPGVPAFAPVGASARQALKPAST